MCSLVMSLFSHDYIKTEIKYQQCFNLLTRVQYSHSAWFLDGRTSIFVLIFCECNALSLNYIGYESDGNDMKATGGMTTFVH